MESDLPSLEEIAAQSEKIEKSKNTIHELIDYLASKNILNAEYHKTDAKPGKYYELKFEEGILDNYFLTEHLHKDKIFRMRIYPTNTFNGKSVYNEYSCGKSSDKCKLNYAKDKKTEVKIFNLLKDLIKNSIEIQSKISDNLIEDIAKLAKK